MHYTLLTNWMVKDARGEAMRRFFGLQLPIGSDPELIRPATVCGWTPKSRLYLKMLPKATYVARLERPNYRNSQPLVGILLSHSHLRERATTTENSRRRRLKMDAEPTDGPSTIGWFSSTALELQRRNRPVKEWKDILSLSLIEGLVSMRWHELKFFSRFASLLFKEWKKSFIYIQIRFDEDDVCGTRI